MERRIKILHGFGPCAKFAKIHHREISSDRVTRDERRQKILTTVNRSPDDDDSGRSKLVGRACLICGVQCNLCEQRTENIKSTVTEYKVSTLWS